MKPSDKQALARPALAAVREAFAAVPGAIVGPSTSDLCSELIAVVVPLRGGPLHWKPAKLALKAAADTYDGVTDTDTLSLTCDPAS